MEKSEIEKTSYGVYNWIRSQNDAFDVVQFTASSGNGYHTLRAYRQGLLCFRSKFITILDRVTKSIELGLEAHNSAYVSTEADTLKLDYMQQKSIELADAAVVSSKFMLDFAIDNNWEMPPETFMIKYLSSVQTPKRAQSRSWRTKSRELLFIGPMNYMRGLSVFADALDYLVEKSLKPNSNIPAFKVRFIGPNDYIGGMSSEDYLELRSVQWGDLNWDIELSADLNRTLTYAHEPKSGRMIVLPSILEPSGYYTQESLYAGAPIISSNLPASWEAIHPDDRNEILFPANNSKALAEKLANILINGGTCYGFPCGDLILTFLFISARWSTIRRRLGAFGAVD